MSIMDRILRCNEEEHKFFNFREENIALKNGANVQFIVKRCFKCNENRANPEENYKIAIKEGSPEEIKRLKDYKIKLRK